MVNAMKFAFFSVALVFLTMNTAFARWKAEYAKSPAAVQRWFATQHNSNGEWCCDKTDGHRYDGNYSLNSDGSVTLADGHKIEAAKVLTGPNPTGHAIWWHMGDHDFCFAPGPMG